MLIALDQTVAEKIESAIRSIENELVNENYEKVVALTKDSRLTAKDVETALKNYSGKVTVAPGRVFDILEAIEISNFNPKAWAIDYDLWIDGKRSDLTLSLTVSFVGDETISSINNLHIL
ncbi:MAG: hypothetical protein UW69_C0009G0019 [Microgenomates group bacterium GW2011_GWA2_44_7]|nr:MAG: hypothetical protein UW69_C0009G0019 [Microgenomates group bacterium GW2011_GWA2_44_7]KKT78156.1 MAG: hypothetical protein UW73_C0006G0038 [Microgenomates group bacterium GW2011_GWB1_44_8]